MHHARITSALALVVVATLLAGCSSDDASDAAATSSASVSASPYLPVPDGVQLTPQGTELTVGDNAVVAYEPRQNEVGVLDLDVTKLEQTTVRKSLSAWQLTAAQKKSTPYYAHISVKNVGSGDLSGASPATYINGVDDRGQDQNEVIFFGSFDRCDDTAPKSFKPGSSYDACLAYLLPGGGALTGFHWIQFDEKSGKADLTWK